VHGDGDGWVVCDLGHRHWGRHGAAGLFLASGPASSGPASSGLASSGPGTLGRIVLQHRALRTHEGGTWGLPGGARDSHEDAVDTALREAAEEAGIDPRTVEPGGLSVVEHGGWSYTTVLARADGEVRPHAANWESDEVRWCDVSELDRLPLHPGFGASWPALRTAPRPVTVIVDAANVVGSRPDGWWRDRAGANHALRTRVTALAGRGVNRQHWPVDVDCGPLDTVLPRWVFVVEGAATDLDGDPAQTWSQRLVHTVRARAAGDDEVVRQAHALVPVRQVVVVTADRELRARLPDAASAVGPTWLLARLDAADDRDDGPDATTATQ
jgi:8-oxo-dGTP diphosphatase